MKPDDYYSIADIAAALNIHNETAVKIASPLPYKLFRCEANHKRQRMYHRDVVLPACIRYKKEHTIPDGWLSASEASEKFKVSTSHINRLVRKDKLTYKTKMNMRIYSETEIKKVLAQARAKISVSKARTFLTEVSFLFSQLKDSLFINSQNANIIDEKSIELFKLRRANLISKLNEIEL